MKRKLKKNDNFFGVPADNTQMRVFWGSSTLNGRILGWFQTTPQNAHELNTFRPILICKLICKWRIQMDPCFSK